MAEFMEVMKHKKRMCKKYSGGGICQSIDYIMCPLKGHELCSKPITLMNIDKIQEDEAIIMQWAKDNPEPVYETWLQFVKRFETGKPKSDSDFIYWMGTTSIPADIAQKLGIEPLPVTHCDCGATNEADARKKLGIEPKEG